MIVYIRQTNEFRREEHKTASFCLYYPTTIYSCSDSLISVSLMSQSSSDSESSTQSSVGMFPQPAAGFAAVRNAEDRLSKQLQRVTQFPLQTPLEDGNSQIAIKEGCNPQHTPSPQLASQGLHTHNSHAGHNDTDLESNSPTTLRSSEECVGELHVQMANRSRKNEEENGTRGNCEDDRDVNGHPECVTNVPLPIPEAAHTVLRERREHPPGLESDSALGHKPHLSNSQLASSVKLQQNTTQRPQTPASDSCSYPELQTGSRIHHSNNPNTSREVPLPVSCTSEEQQASVSSDPILSKDRNADKGQNTGMVNGYSQMTSRYAQDFTPPQRLADPSRPSLVHPAGK